MNIVDLESATLRVREFIDSLGEDVLEWFDLRIAAIREHVEIPADVIVDLPRPPIAVNRQRWAILDGLNALFTQAMRHWAVTAANGNRDLAAIAGGEVGALPILNESGGAIVPSYELKKSTRLGFMAAVNLSLGVSVPGHFEPDDPVNLATRRVAAVVPVVMAAGNARRLRSGAAAYTKWAKAPWVIAVTALRQDGLAPDSAIGDPNDDPTSWPTVAAPDDQLTVFRVDRGEVEAHRGTSVAAVVVSGELILLASFCLTVLSTLQEAVGTSAEGVARVGAGILDTGFDSRELSTPVWPYGSLPIIGLSRSGVERIATVVSQTGLDCSRLTPTAEILKRVLLASARRVEGCEPYQVGAGEISPATTAVYLTRLTTGEYLRQVLGNEAGAAQAVALAGEVPLTDESLPAALDIWRSGAFAWFYDFRSPGPLWSWTFVQPMQERHERTRPLPAT